MIFEVDSEDAVEFEADSLEASVTIAVVVVSGVVEAMVVEVGDEVIGS